MNAITTAPGWRGQELTDDPELIVEWLRPELAERVTEIGAALAGRRPTPGTTHEAVRHT